MAVGKDEGEVGLEHTADNPQSSHLTTKPQKETRNEHFISQLTPCMAANMHTYLGGCSHPSIKRSTVWTNHWASMWHKALTAVVHPSSHIQAYAMGFASLLVPASIVISMILCSTLWSNGAVLKNNKDSDGCLPRSSSGWSYWHSPKEDHPPILLQKEGMVRLHSWWQRHIW